MTRPYRSYSAYLKERYGEPVYRVSLDAGLGCPHREAGRGAGGCIFCGPTGSGSGAHDQGISVEAQMAAGIRRLEQRGIRKYMAYFQAFCNTDGDPVALDGLYRQAVGFPGVVGLSVGTRPDMVPDAILKVFSRLAQGEGLEQPLDVWLELGLQSAHDETLRRIRRDHDTACFDHALMGAHEAGLHTAAHVILGLPGEGEAEMMQTAEHLQALPLDGIKLHHLYVEVDTELARIHGRGDLQTLTQEEYIHLAMEFLRRLRKEVVVLRLSGKADPARSVAPRWPLKNPGAIAQKIESEMRKMGFSQGDLCGD